MSDLIAGVSPESRRQPPKAGVRHISQKRFNQSKVPDTTITTSTTATAAGARHHEPTGRSANGLRPETGVSPESRRQTR